jgi:hypothetical protein
MLYFPQISMYPVVQRFVQRTVLNTLEDGRVDYFADPAAAAVAWDMHLKGMTAVEWDAVQALFNSVAGRWQTFTFLDPVGNLLSQSETFSVPPWTASALLSLTPGVVDPMGTTRATSVVNTGGAAESLTQTLPVPDAFLYCFSVWARSANGSAVTLLAGSESKEFTLSSSWARFSYIGSGTTFGIQLDAGAAVELFGMQLEMQIAPSDYKKTGARGGVYSKARFADDQLTATRQGTDIVDAVIRVVSTEG